MGGIARPGDPAGLVTRLREYLDTRRVQRVAIPLIIATAVIVVAAIFLSSAAKRPITEIAPEVAPAPPPPPSHAAIHLNSEPPGAEVLRLIDSHRLGTTPVVDIRSVDGRQINYRFHLAGYVDVQMPIQVTSSGKFEITATLSPLERRVESSARARASSRRGGRGHDEKHAATSTSASATVAAPVAAPAPAAQPRERMVSPTGLPPLGERNPVRRLGR
jgi:hypothetical protein